MKQYAIPFDYSNVLQIKKKRAAGKTFCDTQPKYYNWLLHEVDPDGTKYLMVGQQLKAYKESLPSNGTVVRYEAVEDKYAGMTAFIVCPGPSMAMVSREALEGKLTFGVNGAGWKFAPRYWVAGEWEWTLWLYRLDHNKIREIGPQLDKQDWFVTPRAAINLWRRKKDYPKLPLYRSVIVSRLEEERAVPFPVDGTTTFNAIAAAWWMGCTKCVIFGLDLSKSCGAYVNGAPHSPEGAANPYNAQTYAMRQCKYPGMTIYNASPVSQKDLQFEPITAEAALALLAESPVVE